MELKNGFFDLVVCKINTAVKANVIINILALLGRIRVSRI